MNEQTAWVVLTWAFVAVMALAAVLWIKGHQEEEAMNSHLNYWRRSFRRFDQVTQRVARTTDDISPTPWADSAVLDAVLGKPLAVIEPPLDPRVRDRRIARVLILVAIVLLAVIALAACGGGEASAQDIAEADAAVHQVSIQPVDCGGGVTCR